PRKLAFFTGRDQSQALTGWWAMQFGTPNFAAHGGFCSVNMAAAGMYTFGGSFWEFGETDWDHTRYFVLFGVAEDHASNPLKLARGTLKAGGVEGGAVHPGAPGLKPLPRGGDPINPGPGGPLGGPLFPGVLAPPPIGCDSLGRSPNPPWLVIRDPGAAD